MCLWRPGPSQGGRQDGWCRSFVGHAGGCVRAWSLAYCRVAGGSRWRGHSCGRSIRHLHVAEWLMRLGGVDVHAVREYAFRCACGNGHLVVAQWLVGLGAVDRHVDRDNAFRNARGWKALFERVS